MSEFSISKIPDFDFPEDTGEYQDQISAWLAYYSSLAYESRQNIADKLKKLKAQKVTFFMGNSSFGFLVQYPTTEKRLAYSVLVFRGTSNYVDILNDVTFLKRDLDGNEGRVHGGFLSALNEIWGTEFKYPKEKGFTVCSKGQEGVSNALQELTLEQQNKPHDLYFTGHSLGGAMAALAAHIYDVPLAERAQYPNYISLTALYTIGCPKSMTTALANKIKTEQETYKTHRIINAADMVPRLPFFFFGFRHYQKEIFLTQSGMKVVHPSPLSSVLMGWSSPFLIFIALFVLLEEIAELCKDNFTLFIPNEWFYNIVIVFLLVIVFFLGTKRMGVFFTDHFSSNYYNKLQKQAKKTQEISNIKALGIAWMPHVCFISLFSILHFAVEETEDYQSQMMSAQYEWLPNIIISSLMTIIFFWVLKIIHRQ